MRDMQHSLIGVCASVLLCAGCAPDQPPANAPAATLEQGSAAAQETAALPADSGLAIKRGILTLAEDRATFRPCGSEGEWWVLDQSASMQTQTLIEESQTSPTELYVEVYGERAPADEQPEASGFEATLVLEEVLYAGVPGEVRGCDAADPTYVVSARGNEPFWAVEVRDEQVVWRQPSAPQEIVFASPQTQDAEGAVRYSATAEGHELELMVNTQPCRDSMSGEFFAFTAKARLDATEFSGCARVGR